MIQSCKTPCQVTPFLFFPRGPCGKVFPGNKSLLAHMARAAKCKASYPPEEFLEIRQRSRRRSRRAYYVARTAKSRLA